MGRRSDSSKKLREDLRERGPHRVLLGDLGITGTPGVVASPAEGENLPVVALGHGWMQPAARYSGLLEHLASWGIVAAAPDTQRYPVFSARSLAADLLATLRLCVGVRLGSGQISVDPQRLALAGHSIGAGAAVLAAAQAGAEDLAVRAVATMASVEVHPSATAAAHRCDMPGLHLTAGRGGMAPDRAHTGPLAAAWAGSCHTVRLAKAEHLGFTYGRHWTDRLLDGKPDTKTQRESQVLLTAFFLHHLRGAQEYAAVIDEAAEPTA